MGNNCCNTKAKLQKVGPIVDQKKPEWRRATPYLEPPVEVKKVEIPKRAKQGKVEGWTLNPASDFMLELESQISDNSSDLSTAESDLKSTEVDGL